MNPFFPRAATSIFALGIALTLGGCAADTDVPSDEQVADEPTTQPSADDSNVETESYDTICGRTSKPRCYGMDVLYCEINDDGCPRCWCTSLL